MKQFKLAFLLTVLMSMVGANAYAQNEPFKVDGIYYRYSPYQDYSVDVVHPNATAVEEDDQSISIPSSYLGSITIPSFISVTKTVTDMNEWGDEYTHEETHSYSVENIGSCAFSGSEITSIVIPNSVTIILSGAFASCTKLSSIIIPNSVVGINQYAFSGCSGLNSVDIPQSVIYLGESAFAGCDNLTSVTVRMEVPVSIDESVFSNRTNATLYVPAGCKEAYMAAPYWQDFKEIVEMSPIITFADYYVKDICVSKWDTDGDGELSEDEAAAVTSLGRAFKNNRYIKSFNELRFFTGLTSIQDEEFYYCTKLSTIIIPKNVTSIGRSAFFDCESLNSLTIPSSVNNIGNSAFLDCGLGLTSITVESGNSKYDSRNNCNAIIETETNKLLWGCNNTIIPNSVTSIDNSAFSHCMLMTTINIPDLVTNIGDYAFYNCEKLTSVVIPDLVTSIGEDAFWHCDDLLSVTIGEKVESIGSDAFSDCYNLTSVTIPKSVTSIGNYAFYGCSNLTSVTVEIETPLSITSNTFSNRANATLYVPAGCKAAYEAADYWKEFKEIVELSPNIEFADANVKALCVANWDTDGDGELSEAEAAAVTSLGTIFKGNKSINTFKELNYFTGLTIIGKSAFEDCSNLVSITIPNSVTTIGNDAFNGCSGLTSLTIPSNVTNISNYAFCGCSGLTSLNIPNSVTYIGECTFSKCSSLASIKVDNGNAVYDSRNNCNAIIETTSNKLLFGCKNTVIPNNVTSLGIYAFWRCIGMTSITIPNSVTSIDIGAFAECCGLTAVTIPNSVTSIGARAFYDCSGLGSIVIPSSVSSISGYVFAGCSCLTSITIPNSMTSIDDGAFWGCSSLSSITIPNSVTSIGSWAFYYCSSLTSIILENEIPLQIASNVFSNRANATLYVPKGCKAAYEAADYWKEFKEIVELSPNIEFADANVKALCVANWDTDGDGELSEAEAAAVTNLGSVFNGNKTITAFEELRYFTGLTSIYYDTFYGCSHLTFVTIPNSVTYIADHAFDGCEGLTFVIIPNSVTTIGACAFQGCYGLTSVTIGNSVKSIGYAAFNGCCELTSVTIPNSVTSIGDYVFCQCSGLTTIVVELGNPKYDSRNDCNAIIETSTNTLVTGCKNTIIPNSVMSIGEQAFYFCTGLTSIEIPNSVTSIGYEAFGACYNLASVIVEHEIPLQITSNVFYNSNYRNATLYVPVGCKAAYEAANYWKEFKEIVEMGPDSEPGDLNGDGIINGVDLVAQTNLILTDQYNATADLNNDGVVNGLDYVIMVNLILSETSAPAMQAAGSNRVAATSSLSIENFDIKAGETKEMYINLSNPNTDLTLLQFDMRLPEGLSIATEDGDYAIDIAGRTTWKKHSLMAKATNGITRFLLASNSNALIDGDNGNVISIKLTASDDFKGGDIWLENQLLVTPDAEDVVPADFIYSVGSTTSINAIMAGQPADVYTLTGTKVLSGVTSLKDLPKGIYIIKGKKVIVK